MSETSYTLYDQRYRITASSGYFLFSRGIDNTADMLGSPCQYTRWREFWLANVVSNVANALTL